MANLLRDLNYSCQANSKVREGGTHPDRDAQFNYIHAIVKEAIADGEPAISVDTKKKELGGDFKNNGKELRSKGQPEQVRTHDFKIPALGKVLAQELPETRIRLGKRQFGLTRVRSHLNTSQREDLNQSRVAAIAIPAA